MSLSGNFDSFWEQVHPKAECSFYSVTALVWLILLAELLYVGEWGVYSGETLIFPFSSGSNLRDLFLLQRYVTRCQMWLHCTGTTKVRSIILVCLLDLRNEWLETFFFFLSWSFGSNILFLNCRSIEWSSGIACRRVYRSLKLWAFRSEQFFGLICDCQTSFRTELQPGSSEAPMRAGLLSNRSCNDFCSNGNNEFSSRSLIKMLNSIRSGTLLEMPGDDSWFAVLLKPILSLF